MIPQPVLDVFAAWRREARYLQRDRQHVTKNHGAPAWRRRRNIAVAWHRADMAKKLRAIRAMCPIGTRP